MSHKKHKNQTISWTFLSSLLPILTDVCFAYKNFFHWNISKILISLWSFVLGIVISLPILISIIVFGFLDPIDWSDIIVYILSGTNEASYELMGGIAMHPYNFVLMMFLLIAGISFFLLGSAYSLFLKAQLSLSYVKSKKLHYNKNYYFNRQYILKFIGIISWSFVYILLPIIIWVGVIFFMYLFYNIGFLSFDALSLWVGFYTFILIFVEVYLLYRLMFGYIILADDSKKKHLQRSLFYVKKSIKITKGKSFLRFIIIYLVFVLLVAPITILDTYLEEKGGIMRDAMVYNSGLLQNLDPEQIQYYEYISQEYNHLSLDELSSKLNSLAILRFILYFISYLLISGIFVLLVTSFYRRVLLGK